MIKSLAPLAAVALLGAAVIAPPLLAPDVKAAEGLAGDTVNRRGAVIRDCSDQVWPHFEASCLRQYGSGVGVPHARLVTAPR